jgi:Gpi18-like mannosyltransferase
MTIPPTLRLVAPRAALIWAVTRLVYLVVTLTSGAPFAQRWIFWDANYYYAIAQKGYPATDHLLPAYFPLFPLLIRGAMFVVLPEIVAAIAASSLTFLAALIAVGWLADGDWAPMLLLAASPLAFFLSGIYADGLFVALAAGALLAYRHERWALCGVLAALSMVARPFGVALVAALIIAALAERRGWRVWLWLAALPEMLFEIWATYLYATYDDPLEFAHAERVVFGRALTWPWQTIWLQAKEFVSMPAVRAHMLLDIIPAIVCVAMLVIMWKRWPLAWTLYVAFALLLMLITPVTDATGQYALISAGRYTYAAVPVLLASATYLQRLPRPAIAGLLAASFALQIGLLWFVLHGGWIV